MAVDIGPKIGLDGESEFRKQLQNVNQSLKTLGSEMKLVTAEFAANADSEEALTKKNDVLERSVSTLRDKLEMQQKALQESAQKFGEADARTMKWQQAVNETEAALATAENQIKENTNAIDKLGDETEETAEKGKSFGEKFKTGMKVAAEAITILTTAALAAATAVGKLTLDSAAWADDINTLSAKTGISTEELQKFQYASERIDVSMETLAGSMSKLTKNMASAQGGSGAAADAFESLGVSVVDAEGNLRDNEDVFKDTIKALSNIDNEAERDATAMAVFGKSAQELNPLILGGADALEQLGAEAEAAGLILGQESLDKLNGLNDAVDSLKATTEAAGHQFSVGFAGPMADAVNLVTGYMQQLTASFDGGFDSMGQAVGSILTDITGQITRYLPDVVNFGMEIIMSLVEGITGMLPELLQTGILIITTVVTSLSEHLPELVPVAVEAILTLVDTLLSNVDQLVDASIEIIFALTDGLIAALPTLLDQAPVIVEKLVSALVENAPKLLESGLQLIVKLVAGLIENLPQIGTAAVDIVTTLLEGIADLFVSFVDMGRNIVEGIVEGIQGAFDWAWQQVKNFFKNIIDGVKDFLGIHSPSTVFAGIGENMAAGLGVGWDREFGAIKRDINGSMESLLPDSTANIGVVSSMRGTGVRSAMADSVNAIGSMMGGNTGNLTIQMVVNGREFSRAILPDFRLVQAQNPIIVNDF